MISTALLRPDNCSTWSVRATCCAQLQMSESLLIREGDRTSISTGKRAVKSVRTFLGIRDEFQNAAIQALNGHGGPRRKYLFVVIDAVQKDQQRIEDYVVTCHALSPWATKHATCCKCLTSLLVIMQIGPPVASTCIEPITQFLSTIRDTWANEDMFLSQFAVVVLSRLSFLTEHPEFSNHFNLNATSSNGLSLPQIEPSSELSVLSQMLAMQGRVHAVMQVGLKCCKDIDYFRAKEREAVKYALFSLYEDAFCANVASCTVLQSISQREARASGRTESSGTVAVLKELYCEHFATLRSHYVAVQDLQNSSTSAAAYSVMGLELSRCPEANPLEGTTGAVGSGMKLANVLHIERP
jgi:hypothetical protein